MKVLNKKADSQILGFQLTQVILFVLMIPFIIFVIWPIFKFALDFLPSSKPSDAVLIPFNRLVSDLQNEKITESPFYVSTNDQKNQYSIRTKKDTSTICLVPSSPVKKEYCEKVEDVKFGESKVAFFSYSKEQEIFTLTFTRNEDKTVSITQIT